MPKDKKDIFDAEEELKNNKNIKTGDFKDRTRFPLVMHVDAIQFEPATPLNVITRTAYDLMLDERQILELHEWTGERIKEKQYKDARIRFIGRIES
jgi:hypothetical protein